MYINDAKVNAIAGVSFCPLGCPAMKRRKHLPHRQLKLVDLENLAGRPVVTLPQARQIAGRLTDTIPHGPTDLQAVATAHISGFAAKAAFPGAHVQWRSGRDGADLALLEYAGQLPLERFESIVIASADAIFAGLAHRAKTAGLSVVIVADPRRIAPSYRDLADTFVPFRAVAA